MASLSASAILDGMPVNCGTPICQEGSPGGIVLPFFFFENRMHDVLRAVFYAAVLSWFLMGAAIGSDALMVIVQKTVSRKARQRKRRRGWNEALANLSLVALASSAPELLLTSIELWSNDLHAGDLGPGTILGSCACEMLLGAALCLWFASGAEPKVVARRMLVFVITAFATIAFLGIYAILNIYTPDVVDVREAGALLAAFPVVLFCAWVADHCADRCGRCRRRKKGEEIGVAKDLDHATIQDLADIDLRLLRDNKEGMSADEIAELIDQECGDKIGPAHYRSLAIANFVGRKRLSISEPSNKVAKKVSTIRSSRSEASKSSSAGAGGDTREHAHIEFVASQYTIMEDDSAVKMQVRLTGGSEQDCPVTVRYRTRSGTATEDKDYEKTEGSLKFTKPNEVLPIRVQIINDDEVEDDEDFWVDLFDLEKKDNAQVCFGHQKSTRCVIVDDDHPGLLGFEEEELQVQVEEDRQVQVHELKVVRTNGARGRVRCRYRFEKSTALPGKDYKDEKKGFVTFEDGQLDATIRVELLARRRVVEGRFNVILEDPSTYHAAVKEGEAGKWVRVKDLKDQKGGLSLRKAKKGEQNPAECAISILPDQGAATRMQKALERLKMRRERQRLGKASWKDQILSSMLVGGGDEFAEHPPSLADFLIHLLTVFWKVMFALVPSVEWCGSFVCICCCLVLIGIITVFISDSAKLLGCILGIPDVVMGMTFVSLGVSLPDSVALGIAALKDYTADSSIGRLVANSSVKVFVGLGLPWLVGALSWEYQKNTAVEYAGWRAWAMERGAVTALADYPTGGRLVVRSRDGLSSGALALAFLVLAVWAIFAVRRGRGRVEFREGELGGDKIMSRLAAVLLMVFWFGFLGIVVAGHLYEDRPCD